jgi:hypothetical protein
MANTSTADNIDAEDEGAFKPLRKEKLRMEPFGN